MTDLVTTGDVAAALGRPLEADEKKQVEFWIRTAKAIIRNKLGDLDALDQENLKLVITSAVARLARNPEGLESVRIDDYSHRLSESARTVEVSFTAQEWELLTPKREASLGTIRAASHIGDRYGNWEESW